MKIAHLDLFSGIGGFALGLKKAGFQPICTKHSKWNWAEKGNPDDQENENYQQPHDPNQLELFESVPRIINENWIPEDAKK